MPKITRVVLEENGSYWVSPYRLLVPNHLSSLAVNLLHYIKTSGALDGYQPIKCFHEGCIYLQFARDVTQREKQKAVFDEACLNTTAEFIERAGVWEIKAGGPQ